MATMDDAGVSTIEYDQVKMLESHDLEMRKQSIGLSSFVDR